MKFSFDHTKKIYYESIGVTKEELDSIQNRAEKLTDNWPLEQKGTKTYLLEAVVAENFSKEELEILVVEYLVRVIRAQHRKKHMDKSLEDTGESLNGLKKFLESLAKMEAERDIPPFLMDPASVFYKIKDSKVVFRVGPGSPPLQKQLELLSQDKDVGKTITEEDIIQLTPEEVEKTRAEFFAAKDSGKIHVETECIKNDDKTTETP